VATAPDLSSTQIKEMKHSRDKELQDQYMKLCILFFLFPRLRLRLSEELFFSNSSYNLWAFASGSNVLSHGGYLRCCLRHCLAQPSFILALRVKLVIFERFLLSDGRFASSYNFSGMDREASALLIHHKAS